VLIFFHVIAQTTTKINIMAGNMKTLAIVLIVALVAGLAATGGWAIYEGKPRAAM
jgi:hypothetical protein